MPTRPANADSTMLASDATISARPWAETVGGADAEVVIG
jgi:hypothetical protein